MTPLAAVSFDLNLAQFLTVPILMAGLGGLIWLKRVLFTHLDKKATGIEAAVAAVDKKVDGVISTQIEQDKILRVHAEDIAYLKGVHAGKTEVAQAAAAALNSISLPHEGGTP